MYKWDWKVGGLLRELLRVADLRVAECVVIVVVERLQLILYCSVVTCMGIVGSLVMVYDCTILLSLSTFCLQKEIIFSNVEDLPKEKYIFRDDITTLKIKNS